MVFLTVVMLLAFSCKKEKSDDTTSLAVAAFLMSQKPTLAVRLGTSSAGGSASVVVTLHSDAACSGTALASQTGTTSAGSTTRLSFSVDSGSYYIKAVGTSTLCSSSPAIVGSGTKICDVLSSSITCL